MINPIRWFFVTVKPWKWRPFLNCYNLGWSWSLGGALFLDLATGFHFNSFGIRLVFGPWFIIAGVRDND